MPELVFTNEDIDIHITEDLVDKCEAKVKAAINEISKYDEKTLSLTKYNDEISYFFHKPNAFTAIKHKCAKMHGQREQPEGLVDLYSRSDDEIDILLKTTHPIVLLYSNKKESLIYLYSGQHRLHKLFHVIHSNSKSFEIMHDLIGMRTSFFSELTRKIFSKTPPFIKACGSSAYCKDLALRLTKLKNTALPEYLKGFYGTYFDKDILNMYSTKGCSEELVEFCKTYPSYFKLSISYTLETRDFMDSSKHIKDLKPIKKIRKAICQKKNVDATVRETLKEMFPKNDDIYKIAKTFKPNFVVLHPRFLLNSIESNIGINIEKLNSFELCWAMKYSDLRDKIFLFRNQIRKKGDTTKIIKGFQKHLGKRKIRTTFDDLNNITDTVKFLANHGFKAQNPKVLMDIDRRYHDIHHILLSKAANFIDKNTYKSELLERKRINFDDLKNKADIKMLISEEDFINEGSEMSHCVGGYYNSFCRGELFIFSIQTEKERSTLEVKLRSENKFAIAQHRSVGNSRVENNKYLAKLIIDQLNEKLSESTEKLKIKVPTNAPKKIHPNDFDEHFRKRYKLKKISTEELYKVFSDT